ncbi:toxin glutamine deamidase domain-containing protein [Kitasatospora phosalacinea]|uniref:WXG100-like domain-containing protein n=1 Tax=Kitasatospora phosalacinea TaxID=2065 RepID=UPI0005249254|nr:toxin glutamine deamidase domain-containing protein [Kitasatospora phosalacinea]
MAVELPEPLQWVLLLLAGTRWPEADEDQLRHMAEHCRKAAENLKDAAQSADSTVKRALDGQQGVAAEALGKYWEETYTVGGGTPDKPGSLPGAVDSLNGMGDMLEEMANSAETAKIQIIAQLGILAFELATAEAEAPFTAGASLLQVPVMIGASRVVVQQILKQLLKETLKMAAKQATQMAAINFLAQGIELAEGHRKSINMSEVGQNALGGAVGGASAHLIGKGIGAGGKKLGAENALNSTAGKVATGAAIGVGADVSTQLITTGGVDSGSLLGSGLSGGAGAGLHAGASAIKSHTNVPKAVDTPKLDLPDTAGAGHDGPPTFTKPATSSGDSTYRGPSGTTTGDSGATETAGAGAGAAAGTRSGGSSSGTESSSVGAGSSVGHSSATGAGESKVTGLVPFGSDRSTGTTASTPTGTTTHETATPAPTPHEQAAPQSQETAVPRVDTRTAAPRTEAEPAMVHSVNPTTGQSHETPVAQSHEAPVAQSHEAPVPRQEPVAQSHQSATPPAEHVASQPHETPAPQPHETPVPQSHEAPVPRQEPVAQSHQSATPPAEHVASQPHETPAPQPHETPQSQSHETPVPRQEPAPRVEPVAAQPHETPAPQPHETPQPQSQSHETPVPRQEPASHEAPAPRQEPVAQSHQSATPPAEHVASQPHERPTPQPHETSVPRQESPASTNETVAPRVTEHPVGSTTAQQSAVPNLSGVLGGAANLAGGGGTHLDGGTRTSSAPAAARPAGPEQLPGQVLPDAVPEAAPSSTAAQPPAGTPNPMMGGAYVPGAVSGGAGGSGRATPAGAVPPQGGGRQTPVTGPVRTEAGESGGGTIRSGAGRVSDPRLPSPPPPPHQEAGTSRALGDPDGAAPSSSRNDRNDRSRDEQLPPPPPPADTRIRPVDEPPTAAELAQLHQHPAGPALIHPPAADPAALRRYKLGNKLNFRLTGELEAAANSLPHSSWGRHDSGNLLPDGRPDVKVSPYSQSFKSHLDPLTFKALHLGAAKAVTDPLRTELGPEAMAFQGNQVLEAAGSLDFRTQEHFQQQEARRNVLERLARQDSQRTWQPVDGQRVTDQLDGSTSAADGVNRLLGGHDGRPGFDGIVLGESHSQSPSWGFLSENMHDLKAAGVDRIYVESLRDDAFQRDLDAYQRPGGTMSPNLENMLRTYDGAMNSPDGKGLYDTVVRAKAEGVTVHAVDGYPARRPYGPGTQALEERARLLNSYMNHAVSSGGPGKYVLVTGTSHVHEHPTSTEHRIPGVAEMLGVPAVKLTDAGRPNPNGAPHDATVTTESGNLRLGYLPPERTGHDPADTVRPGGNDAPPAPGPDRGSPAPSTRGLGDETAHDAPPTPHDTPSSTHDTPSTPHDAPPVPPTEHGAPPAGGHDRSLEAPVHDPADRSGREEPSAVPPAGADRLRRDLPHMSPQERAQELANLTPENRRWLARDPQTVDALKDGLPPREFARTAAELMVHVDPRAERAPSARQEAQQQVARMLQDPETTARLLKNGADVVIVPKDVRMPDVPELNHLSGVHNDSSAGGGRGYDDMRGSGGRHSAVTEENLLGEHTPIGPDGHYQDGYSTTTHEFSHTVHRFGLDPHDQQLITDTFNGKREDPNAAWPDGPLRGADGETNYSSRDEQEYFAQLTNAYLGNNHGTDPYTGQPRNNGAAWVRENEPAMVPLLEKLYGGKPDEVHTGHANPVHATTAENRMYEGLREFMDHVDGDGSPAPDRRPPSEQPPSEPATAEPTPPPAAARPQAGPGPHGADASHLPPPPPKAKADDELSHKIKGEDARKAIKDFLPDSTEFDKVAAELMSYERSALKDGDTNAIMAEYGQRKQLHLDLLRRNVPERLAEVNRQLDDIAGQTPERRAELADEQRNLETAKAHLEEQRGRLAIYDHESALLKGAPKPGTPAFKALQDARQQAEKQIVDNAVARGDKDTATRIEDQRRIVADLKQAADQRLQDAETTYQDEHQKRLLAGLVGPDGKPMESPAESAAKTVRNVYRSRVEDLQERERELAQDLKTHRGALDGSSWSAPLKKGDKESKDAFAQRQADDAYRAAFGHSDHGVMAAEPHAEKTVRRMADGKVRLDPAVVNRNHVVADYMVHKYVTAAVFKARSFGDEQHRAEASRVFSDFADTMAADPHRVFDQPGKQAFKRLGANSQEQAALAWRDLAYTTTDVDLGKAYGNDRLAPAFSPAKTDDPPSAVAARQEVREQLDRTGLSGPGPVKAGFDRYSDTVDRFSADPSPQHLQEMRDALADVHAKVREQAVDDLALVHGVTGPRHLDETVAAARQAAAEPSGGPGRPAAYERLADRLDDLSGAYDRLGTNRQDLKDLARELRTDPGAVGTDRLEALADTLPNDRDQLRREEAARRRAEAGQTLKPRGTDAARQKAADGLLPKADADLALVAEQYGGAFPRAGAGESHPAGLFDQAVGAKVEDVPGLVVKITDRLSNSASNLRFGDELTNKWIQNYLDPHVIRDQDVLTAVAKGELPPEALYSPHTLDLLRGLRSLEDTGLVPRELRDLMAPKTEADMVELHQPGAKKAPSPSAVNIVAEHGMLDHAGGKVPVSSSGDFTHQPHQSANPVVGAEGMHHPVRDARPGAEGREIGATPPPGTPRSQTPDTDVPMATPDTDVSMATQDTDVPMASQDHGTQTPTQGQDHPMASPPPTRPAKRRVDPDEDTLMTDAPSAKRRQADPGSMPPPPPPASHPAAGGHRGTGAQGFGSLPSPPPPGVQRGAEPMDLDSPPRSPAAEPMDLDTPPVEPHPVDRDGDAVMKEADQPPTDQPPAHQPQGAAEPGTKRGREEDEEESSGEPVAKRQRTPEYENSSAVMTDRGYDRIGPEHPLTGELVNYLGGAPKLHPPMSNSLLQKVNPHREPASPDALFRPGNDLNACLENVEAYRDTHFGRPRVSGRTVQGTVEPIPGNTLWKRHDGPALFGQGPDAVQKLMDRVRDGGPGSFATVLGIGASGSGHGHAVALVHDRDGTLRWADLTDRKVTVANGAMPDNYRADWTVWASVADPHENNISGPHDPQFMERFSTFTGSADRPDPMDIDTFGASDHSGPARETDTASVRSDDSSSTVWHDAVDRMSLSDSHRSPTPDWEDAVERQFPPVGPRVQVPGDGLCLLHSIAVSTPGAAGSRSTAEQLRSAVENHFGTLPPEQWPTELVSNHRNDLIARNALGSGNPLGLPADTLQTLGDHAAGNPPPPSARERAALLDTVRNWEARWGSNAGEMLPAAAAHALGLSLRVVGHDGIPRAVLGPVHGQPVTVYHHGDHYDGSRPVPPATEQQPPHPTPEQQKTPDEQQKAPEEQQKAPEEQKAKTEEPEAPKKGSIVEPRPIAGTDLVIGLTEHEGALRQQVVDILTQAVPGDRAAVRAFAEAHFGPATLRPMLRAFSRGETWSVPFEGDGWSGSVKLSGQVTKTVDGGTKKLEFENGADRTVATGGLRDVQWQYNAGLRARHGLGPWEPTEMIGYFHDQGHSQVAMDLGGMVARSKTVQTAHLYESTMQLQVDFGGLRHEGAPVRTASGDSTGKADLGLTVAVPEQTGTKPEDEQRTPPQRLLDGRVGGPEIVLDLAPRGGAEGRQPVETLLEHVEQAARQEFGDNWPAMREKVLAEVDFGLLQQNLKSMTAGEPVTVTLTDGQGNRIGTVEIGARVADLRQTGTTQETEFNIGTSVQQVRSSVTTEGDAGQFGLMEVLRPGPAVFGGGGAGRLGRDRVEIVGESRVSQLTSKSKVPGVVYDGSVRFALSFNGKADAHEAGSADVRLLVDRADTRPPAAKDSGSTPPKDQPEQQQPKDQPEQQQEKQEQPPQHEVPAPPDSVWHGGNDRGGLDETVVVRDLESTAALRSAVDAAGRERFGKEWDAVRDQVMRSFSQPNLAARLTGMTRGEALEVKVPGKEDLVIRAVAKVEGMTYRREDGKAELNPLNETSTFRVDRRLLARTTLGNGELGGTPVPGTPGFELAATGAGQQRERKGGQGRQADRVYANGKYGAPQVIYGAELSVEVSFGRPGDQAGDRPAVSAPVRVEVGLDARETVKVRAPRGEDGTVAFAPPVRSGGEEGASGERRNASEAPRTATHTAPRRMLEQHELNASYVVHTLRGADQVRATVEGALRAKHGAPSAKTEERLDAALDRIALKTQLSRLTRGGKITETVSGSTWKAEITVKARVTDAVYHSSAEKYEFESGTRTSSGHGNVRDTRRRLYFGTRFKVKTPVLDVLGAYAHRSDHSQGQNAESVGSASNRGKHVEPAVFFDVDAAYDVTVKFTRLGVPDGTVTHQVDTVARVAVPKRDARPVEGPVQRTTDTQPGSFADGRRRLDSSAVVTDVHALPQHAHGPAGPDGSPGPRRTFGESVLSQVESGWKPGLLDRKAGTPAEPGRKPERNPFGSDWSGIRRKLDRELTPDRLQSRLKGMTAGDEIVVRHGRTTVRVRAVLRDRMEHLGDSGTTEFNTGTDVQRTFAGTEGSGHSHQGLLGITGSAPVPGAPVSLTPGLSGTGGAGQDHVDVRNSSTSAGVATKSKLPGSAYRGEAELQFTVDRRPWFGASVYRRRTAVIGFESLVETGQTVPVKPAAGGGAAPVKPAAEGESVSVKPTAGGEEPPKSVPLEAPGTVSVSVPPQRVWESGLRDTDVLRFLDDVGGIQDLARLRGPEYFGRSAWEQMEPVVGTVTKHGNLSALFTSASQGIEVSASLPTRTRHGHSPSSPGTAQGNPAHGDAAATQGAETVPVKRVSFGRGKGVEVDVKVVSLEHRGSDKAAELSPANAVSGGSTGFDLSTANGGLQAQFGAKFSGTSSTNTPALVGGGQRTWRAGGGHGESGQTVSNGKIPSPTARYHGYAEVELTLFDGDRKPVKEKGLVPFTVDIPLAETTSTDVPGDHYLSFTAQQRTGELRHGEDARLLDEVHRALGDDQPYDHAEATPVERDRLTGTARLGRAVYGREFTSGPDADTATARVRAAHWLVGAAGGTSERATALLGDLLGTPGGAPLPAGEARKAIDYLAQRSTEGPLTLDDLFAGAQDGWPAHQRYDVHREAWTDHGPANGLVTAAMATAADAVRHLAADGVPTGGRLHLTVTGEGAPLPLHEVRGLDGGDLAEQIRRIEQETYLAPGTSPHEVTVRLAGAPGLGDDWDYRVTARADRSRELTLRHRRPEQAPESESASGAGPQPEPQPDAAVAARVAALRAFAAAKGGAPGASG